MTRTRGGRIAAGNRRPRGFPRGREHPDSRRHSSRPTAASAAGRARSGPRRSRRWPPCRDHVPRHVAPAEDGEGPGRPAAARASPSCSRCPSGYEVILGNGGTTAFWDAATFGLIRDRAQFADVRRVRREVRQGGRRPRRSSAAPTVRKAEPGSAPALVAEAGIDAYATPHNETSTGVAVPVRRVAGADPGALHAARRHLRRRRPRRRPDRDRRLLLRAAEGASAPTAACGSR